VNIKTLLYIAELNAGGVSLSAREERQVVLFLRVVAFFIGLGLLLSGSGDLSNVGNSANIGYGLSIAGSAIVKLLIGIFLIALGINPERVWMSIEWVIRLGR
jgi:hypothetical protein